MTRKKEQRKVIPGELVATAEEYLAGFGTYEDDGMIYSSAVGSLELDDRNKVARLRFDNPPNAIWIGDKVFCEVTNVRPSMVICSVFAVEGTPRGVTGETSATIHVSKLSNRYVEDASQALRITDIARGEVIQARPSIQLTTAKPHLGVVFARCKHCREPMEHKDDRLYCPKCETTEYRKLARDYRNLRP